MIRSIPWNCHEMGPLIAPPWNMVMSLPWTFSCETLASVNKPMEYREGQEVPWHVVGFHEVP